MTEFAVPDEVTRRHFVHRHPTRAEIVANNAAVKARYKLFHELSPDEQEQAIAALTRKRRLRSPMAKLSCASESR